MVAGQVTQQLPMGPDILLRTVEKVTPHHANFDQMGEGINRAS